jgi:hypothetical protein
MRDEFSPKTKRLLADRVGHVCSNPNCRAPTSGPRLESDKAVVAGDAAHITAASPNGPRYDPSLTSEERRHHSNGIWLCVRDARIVDQDKSRYTVELLRRWKAEAEEDAKKRLARPQDHRISVSSDVMVFLGHVKSLIAALETYNENSIMLGIEEHIIQMTRNAELIGIPAPIEIETIPYPEGEIAPNPFLQDRFEGSCVIRFPDGSEDSGRSAHAAGLELLLEARDSAIVALKQWLIKLEHDS